MFPWSLYTVDYLARCLTYSTYFKIIVLIIIKVNILKISHLKDYSITFFIFFSFFRATPMAYGGSQTRSRIGATPAGLHHSHSNAGSEPRLQLMPQPAAMPDP